MKLDFSEYQDCANRTSRFKDKLYAARNDSLGEGEKRLMTGVIGLAGEVGEVADHIKKAVAHGHELDYDKISFELGDVLWYVAEVASSLNLNLVKVYQDNIEKLAKRYPGGFDSLRSQTRPNG